MLKILFRKVLDKPKSDSTAAVYQDGMQQWKGIAD